MKLQNLQTPFVIMSLPTGVCADEVIDYPFKAVMGKYKDKHEVSYLVPVERCRTARRKQIEALRVTADRFEEESILYVDEYRIGMLICCEDGHADVLGKWKQVSRDAADESPACTFDMRTQTYWVVA